MSEKKPKSVLLFEIGIVLLPYDAIHYMMPTTYAPISIYLFFLAFIILIAEKRGYIIFDKILGSLLCFYIYSLLSSTIIILFFGGKKESYFDFILTLTIGIIIFIVLKYELDKFKQFYKEEWINVLLKKISNAYIIPYIVGAIEFLSQKGVLSFSYKTMIQTIFGGWQLSRLCMTTYEASWASMHMLIAFGANWYCYKTYREKKYLVRLILSMFFFFILTSMQGMLALVVAVGLYILFLQYKQHRLQLFVKAVFKWGIILCILFIVFYSILLTMPDTYFASRIIHFTSLKQLLISDASSYIRIGSLFLHLYIFKDYFLFGAGGGRFRILFAQYTMQFYPQAIKLPQVNAIIAKGDAVTTTSVYFSILSEEGIIGVVLIWIFLSKIFKSLKEIESNELIFFLAIILAQPIQFGSWAYVPLWLALAILSNLSWNKHRI